MPPEAVLILDAAMPSGMGGQTNVGYEPNAWCKFGLRVNDSCCSMQGCDRWGGMLDGTGGLTIRGVAHARRPNGVVLCIFRSTLLDENQSQESAQPLGCARHTTRGSLDVAMLSGMGGQTKVAFNEAIKPLLLLKAGLNTMLFAAAGALDKNPKVAGPRSVKFLNFSVQVLEAEVGA